MLRVIVIALLLAPALFSQLLPGRVMQFPPQLKQYLELTDTQVNAISQAYTTFQTFQSGKIQRMAQVQLELSQETAKSTIDPMALGVRYAELEAIRRELNAEQGKVAAQIQGTLTPAQKTKLQSLQQAIQLQPVICEAQAFLLLGGTLPVPAVPILTTSNRWFDTTTFTLPAIGCGAGIRTGDFAGFPTGPVPQP